MPKVNRAARGGWTTWSIHNRDHPAKSMNHERAGCRALAWQLGDVDTGAPARELKVPHEKLAQSLVTRVLCLRNWQ
jgi:hypothetical protein